MHELGSWAKKARTSRSQQPACTHKEHQILTTAEATAFASQFWDGKVHPTKASQHVFLATCIDVNLEENVKPLWKGATMRTIRIQNNQLSLEHCSILCIVQFAAPFAQKCDHLPRPNPHTSETAFSHRFQKIYTYPPQRDEMLAHWTKS